MIAALSLVGLALALWAGAAILRVVREAIAGVKDHSQDDQIADLKAQVTQLREDVDSILLIGPGDRLNH